MNLRTITCKLTIFEQEKCPCKACAPAGLGQTRSVIIAHRKRDLRQNSRARPHPNFAALPGPKVPRLETTPLVLTSPVAHCDPPPPTVSSSGASVRGIPEIQGPSSGPSSDHAGPSGRAYDSTAGPPELDERILEHFHELLDQYEADNPPELPSATPISRADSDLDDEIDAGTAADVDLPDPPPLNSGNRYSVPVGEDPFYYAPASDIQNVIPSPDNIHANPVVYYIYLLVLWLHTQCHLPFRACKAVLVTFAIILSICHVDSVGLKTTLPGVISALNAEPTFRICPVCRKCQKVYGPATQRDEKCCSLPLFDNDPTAADQ